MSWKVKYFVTKKCPFRLDKEMDETINFQKDYKKHEILGRIIRNYKHFYPRNAIFPFFLLIFCPINNVFTLLAVKSGSNLEPCLKRRSKMNGEEQSCIMHALKSYSSPCTKVIRMYSRNSETLNPKRLKF